MKFIPCLVFLFIPMILFCTPGFIWGQANDDARYIAKHYEKLELSLIHI